MNIFILIALLLQANASRLLQEDTNNDIPTNEI